MKWSDGDVSIGDLIEILSFDEIRANGAETVPGDVEFGTPIMFVGGMKEYCGSIGKVINVGFRGTERFVNVNGCGAFMWTANMAKVVKIDPITGEVLEDKVDNKEEEESWLTFIM